jgi:hypothetical protein
MRRSRGLRPRIACRTVAAMIAAASRPGRLATRVRWSVCAGGGNTRARAAHRHHVYRECASSRGRGVVPCGEFLVLQRVRVLVQRVADLMQAGRADDAGTVVREAFRMAAGLLRECSRPVPG